MARIRTVKPEFWTDEKVVELDYSDRLLFIGMWNFADDQGYLDFRPKRIKMQVFPGDDLDVVRALERLWRAGLLALYRGPNGLVLHIINWEKHQRVSNPARERYLRSDLHLSTEWETTVQSPLEPYPAEGKGREGKGRETVDADASESEPDDAFDEFWIRYPRKVAKGAARKAWKAALKKVSDPSELVNASRRFSVRVQGSEEKFIPHASTWLNAERWLDETDAVLSGAEPYRPNQPFRPPDCPPEIAEDGARYVEWLRDERAKWDAEQAASR